MKSVPKLRERDLVSEPDRDVTLLPSGKLTPNYDSKPLVTVIDHKDGSSGVQVVFDDATIERLKVSTSLSPLEGPDLRE